LITKAKTAEAKVFYYKMIGDYYRYQAEISSGEAHRQAADNTVENYRAASAIAQQELSNKSHSIGSCFKLFGVLL